MLATTGAAAIAAAARDAMADDWQPAMHYPDPAVEILDPSFEKYRLSLVCVERVATGLRWAEGPVWFGDFRTMIFSDVSNNRMMAWNEDTGELSVFRKPSNYSPPRCLAWVVTTTSCLASRCCPPPDVSLFG